MAKEAKENPNPFKVFDNDILNGGEGAYYDELVAGNKGLSDIDLTKPFDGIEDIEEAEVEEEEE